MYSIRIVAAKKKMQIAQQIAVRRILINSKRFH